MSSPEAPNTSPFYAIVAWERKPGTMGDDEALDEAVRNALVDYEAVFPLERLAFVPIRYAQQVREIYGALRYVYSHVQPDIRFMVGPPLARNHLWTGFIATGRWEAVNALAQEPEPSAKSVS
jgi:hypothetical protein